MMQALHTNVIIQIHIHVQTRSRCRACHALTAAYVTHKLNNYNMWSLQATEEKKVV